MALCLVSISSLAQESVVKTIDGAFGVQFGQVVADSMIVSEQKMEDGTPIYEFKPEKRFRDFSKYWVLMSPKGKKVHSIIVRGNFDSDELAKRESDLLLSLLTEKYGKKVDKNMFGFEVKQDGVSVSVREVWNGLQITYRNNAMETEAENERLEIEGGKAFVASLGVGEAEVEERITGAFGIKLGDSFAVGDKRPITIDGRLLYAVTPTVPYRSLDAYYVGVTPKTGLVYRIECHGLGEMRQLAHKEQFVLDYLLLKRFGKGAKVDPKADSFFRRTRIQVGERYVETTSSDTGKLCLRLVYSDEKLAEVEKRERIEKESKKVDASGL